MNRGAGLAGSFVVLLLCGCATVNDAPVEDRSSPLPGAVLAPAGAEHVVVAGDTLYGVAFRHDLDYRRLAAWNDIASPYTIQPGQRLRLTPPVSDEVALAAAPDGVGAAAPLTDGTQTFAAAEAPVADAAPLQVEALPTDAPQSTPLPPPARAPVAAAAPATTGPVSAALAGSNTDTRPPAVVATPSPRPVLPPVAPTPAGPPLPAAAPLPTTIAKAPTQNMGGVAWRWPAAGRVANRYVAGDPARQGVDILGREGESVTAAADGEVVYSGNGLLGYGELVIIKHSGDFLSAYGHNRRRLVAEGTRVRAGQPIAEMGKGGGVERLHFEIRRDGKPVDPLSYLPRR